MLAVVSLVLASSVAGPPGGSVDALGDAAMTFAGIADGDATGFAVAAGDLDGDGIDDLVVGAPCHAAGGEGAGAVYVLYGPLGSGRPLADADAVVLGGHRGDFTGEAVGVADLDGDGDDELLIGAPGPFVGTGPLVDGCFAAPPQPGTNRPGRAYVLDGGERRVGVADAEASADAVLSGLSPADFFGMAVAGVGDLDGDGDEDLAVGAHGPGSLPAGAGAVHIFTGEVAGEVSAAEADATLLGIRPGDLTGVVVGGADLDADGRSDLLVSAPGHESPPATAGRVHVVADLPAGVAHLATTGAVLEGEVEDDRAGWGLAAGDLTGGPAADVVVGAPGSDTVHVTAGGERYEGTVPLAEAAIRIDGGAGASFGHAVAVADLDGDGTDELAVGAPALGLPETSGTVAVFAVVDGTLTDADADRRLEGTPGDNAGAALAVADLDGDGIDDLVVGAPSVDAGGPGSVHVVPGPARAGQGSGVLTPGSQLTSTPDGPPAPIRAAALPATGASGALGAVLLAGAWLGRSGRPTPAHRRPRGAASATGPAGRPCRAPCRPSPR